MQIQSGWGQTVFIGISTGCRAEDTGRIQGNEGKTRGQIIKGLTQCRLMRRSRGGGGSGSQRSRSTGYRAEDTGRIQGNEGKTRGQIIKGRTQCRLMRRSRGGDRMEMV